MDRPSEDVAREASARLEDCLVALESTPSVSRTTVGEEEPKLFRLAWEYLDVLKSYLGDTL